MAYVTIKAKVVDVEDIHHWWLADAKTGLADVRRRQHWVYLVKVQPTSTSAFHAILRA